jgi:hypothetical protein
MSRRRTRHCRHAGTAVLIVGKIVGRVERLIPEGFAIEFLIMQDFRKVAELFTKPEPDQRPKAASWRKADIQQAALTKPNL